MTWNYFKYTRFLSVIVYGHSNKIIPVFYVTGKGACTITNMACYINDSTMVRPIDRVPFENVGILISWVINNTLAVGEIQTPPV